MYAPRAPTRGDGHTSSSGRRTLTPALVRRSFGPVHDARVRRTRAGGMRDGRVKGVKERSRGRQSKTPDVPGIWNQAQHLAPIQTPLPLSGTRTSAPREKTHLRSPQKGDRRPNGRASGAVCGGCVCSTGELARSFPSSSSNRPTGPRSPTNSNLDPQRRNPPLGSKLHIRRQR